ncbi:MAG TPA: HEAT repeat domain-containing protein [Chloroflexi bacterium]|nr:HEAT repeat domain-containing protein [Chloroflexota bacterium]
MRCRLPDTEPPEWLKQARQLNQTPRTPADVTRLIEALNDPDPKVRQAAARDLGQIGTFEAMDAVAAWRARQKHRDD